MSPGRLIRKKMFGRTFLQAACGDVVLQLLIGIIHASVAHTPPDAPHRAGTLDCLPYESDRPERPRHAAHAPLPHSSPLRRGPTPPDLRRTAARASPPAPSIRREPRATRHTRREGTAPRAGRLPAPPAGAAPAHDGHGPLAAASWPVCGEGIRHRHGAALNGGAVTATAP